MLLSPLLAQHLSSLINLAPFAPLRRVASPVILPTRFTSLAGTGSGPLLIGVGCWYSFRNLVLTVLFGCVTMSYKGKEVVNERHDYLAAA